MAEITDEGVLIQVSDTDIIDGSLIVPGEVKSISLRCRSNNLTSLTCNNNLSSIKPYSFSQCYELTKVRFSDTITSIGANAFYGCKKLRSPVLPEQLTEMGQRAFSKCESLESIIIPIGVEVISQSLFAGCKNLGSVTLSPNTKRIENWAFQGCPNLGSITIPESIEFMALYAFMGFNGQIIINTNSKEQFDRIAALIPKPLAKKLCEFNAQDKVVGTQPRDSFFPSGASQEQKEEGYENLQGLQAQ